MKIYVISLFLLLLCGSLFYFLSGFTLHHKIVKVGVLHSLTGDLASEEIPMMQAALLAIEEINKNNVIPGIRLKPIVVDGKTDFPTFAREAERLITQENVAVIFGCLSSSSRKSIKPVVEKYNNLLVYPMQWEGLEISPNIIYIGLIPNQQSLPGIMWCFNNLGKKFFLVGTHLIYSHVNIEIMKDHILSLGGSVAGEAYVKLSETNFDTIVQDIIKAKPDVIINNLGGDANNIGFFKALYQAQVTPESIPVMSFTIAENDFLRIGTRYVARNYTTWSYFQTIASLKNENFVKAYKKKYGENEVVNDPMQSEYISIYLWAAAVNKNKTVDPAIIKDKMLDESMDTPAGTVFVDPVNRNTWEIVRVGKIMNNGQVHIIWNAGKPIQPISYPIYRTPESWSQLLMNYYEAWGKQWAIS